MTFLKNTLRDLRSGDLTMLIAAVALAVGALSSVSLFADRLAGAFARDAKQLLGGDAVVVSDQPTPPSIEALAKQYGLQATSTLAFATMATVEGSTKLVALKSVQSGYPLRGNLKIDDGTVTKTIPNAGEVWVENSLLGALDMKLGDEMDIGASRFKIAHILVSEPDRGVGFLNFAPRVMMNAQDLAATQLIQPASRVTYRFAVAGDKTASFNKDVLALLPTLKGVRLDSLESGRPETRQILDTTEKFLNLVALLCALVCAAAVAIAARGFAAKRIDDCALRRVLGQSQMQIAIGFAAEFFLVGLVASLIGCGLGLGLHQVFVSVLAQVMETELPASSLWPLVFGVGVGITLLLGFGLPPVLQLAGTPPLRVLRRDVGEIKAASLLTLLVGVAGFVVLLLVASKDVMLGLMTTGGFAVALLLFAGFAYALLLLLGRLQARGVMRSQTLVLATRQVLAHRVQTTVQVASLSIGLLALFLLILLRSDLLANWQKARPQDAPNRMVINVLPDQQDAFKASLDKASSDNVIAKNIDWYPMIRGRLIAVNDAPVSAADYADERAKRLVEREFNLSNTANLPAHNQLVGGQWTNEEDGAISVEDGLAKTLNLKLGDRLRFDVAGVQVESKITSLRKVDWQSMRANFFVLYPKAAMPDLPVTYLAAFKENSVRPELLARQATPDKGYSAYAFDNQLVRAFPNITLIDLTQSMNEIGSVINKVTRAVESLFAFTLAAGVLVLLATLYATGSHTQRDFALMRALGASRSQLRKVQALQLAGIGALSGFLAASVALALAWGLAKWVFNFEWTLSPALPIVGLLLGAALTLGIGWWALRGILRRPVIDSLRVNI
ncbi:MAG: FtsX-like permease family protein [Cytophagales bacterium]|nr:FtsX-like permease family protein [Cytophagales bacterium]